MNDYWAEQEYTCAPTDPNPIDTEALRKEALGQLGLIAADPRWPGRALALLDALAAAEHRATRAEARAEALRSNLGYWQIRARDMNDERDSWEQIALDEREGARDLLEQVNVRDVRIGAWEQQYTQDTDSLTREVDEAEGRIQAVRELHRNDGRGDCAHCDGLDGMGQEHPCPTIEALEGDT